MYQLDSENGNITSNYVYDYFYFYFANMVFFNQYGPSFFKWTKPSY